MALLHLTLGDDDLGEIDLDKVVNLEWYEIEDQFRLTPKELFEGLEQMRPRAVDALIWLMYKRQGRVVDKSVIRWDLTSLHLELPEENPTEAVNETAETNGSQLSLTSAT